MMDSRHYLPRPLYQPQTKPRPITCQVHDNACSADSREAGVIKEILNQFETVSGQRVNFEKSEICFSRNTPADVIINVCNVLCVEQVASHSRYLDLPLLMGQRKTEICRNVVEKIWKKINDWKSKFFSAAGREVLIKAVVLAMPMYTMSIYLFP
ncbi:hypothetical protein QQ045_027706 [Rhodiola kirilowii]